MPTSIRFDKKTESLLEEAARLIHVSKAEIIKRSLYHYCPSILEEKRRHPYRLIEDLLDKKGSGRGDLSIRGEEILRKAFRRKA
mgnify:FL=1|jgi:hypothetical protein